MSRVPTTDPDPDASPRILRPWSRTARPVPRAIIQPVQQFMHRETSGGIVLAIAALVALAWANLDAASYAEFWHTDVRLSVGSWSFEESFHHIVNDGLMALFFFVIGLEIKREFVAGELRDRQAAMLPLFAAVGGMVVPALCFLAITRGGPGSHGWGIPMATDIAFALGALALLGSRVPLALKVLMLGIAVIDDIGAIVVIALFYGDGVHLGWLLLAALGVLLIEVAKRLHVRALPLYVGLGAGIWLATYESGVHATIAGVVVGLLTPARPFQHPDAVSDAARRIADETSAHPDDPDEDAERWNQLSWLSRQAISPLALVQRALHPWTSYVVLPLFALANVGVVVSRDVASAAFTDPVGLGIVVGLVLGKPVGVLLGSALAIRLGVARLPTGAGWVHMVGLGALAGIGFTVSIFITTLAFDRPAVVGAATFAVLAASCIAGVLGSGVLLAAHRRGGATN